MNIYIIHNIAYGRHYPIAIFPDMILLLRNIYVDFKGQKTLTVIREGIAHETAKPEIWKGIINEITKKIKENVGNEIISYSESDFTIN